MRSTLAALVCLTLAAPARADDPSPRAVLEAFERQLKTVHETSGPCVACVVVLRSEHYPKPAKPPEHAGRLGGFSPVEFLKANPSKVKLATHLDLTDPRVIPEHTYTGGVVVDAAGLVLTTYQPLERAAKIYVHLPGGKGSYADIHAADSRSDLAVLKLLTPPAALKQIKLAEVQFTNTPDGKKGTVSPGTLVVLMTNPHVSGFPLDRPSGGLGAITNVRRSLKTPLEGTAVNRSSYAHGTFLEHDAKLFAGVARGATRFEDPESRMNAGISGAALLNLDGALIGLTTQGHAVAKADYGPGFAFPIDANTLRIIGVLTRGEEVEYGYLGVMLGDELRGQTSLTVTSVATLGPAAMAGIQPFETITRINDVPVSTYGDLQYFGAAALAGTTIKVTVVRNMEPGSRTLNVTLGKYKHDLPYLASVRPDPVFGLRVDYSSILAQSLFNRNRFGEPAPGVPEGVCVRELLADSPAAAKFATLGDAPTRWLVTHANGVPVPTPEAFYKAAKGQKSVKLHLTDPGAKFRTAELTIP